MINMKKNISKKHVSCQHPEKNQNNDNPYYFLVEELPLLICSFKPDGEIIFVNKTYCEYFNKTYEELVGSNFLDLIPETDRKKVMDIFSSLTMESPMISYEHKVIMANGNIGWQRWTDRAIFDSSGNLTLYQSIGEDITERRLTEEALKQSREKYVNILKSIDDGYFEVDIAGNFTFFNDSMCRMLGYDKNELMGVNNREYMDEQTAKKVFKVFNKVYETGISTKALDWKLIRKDGKECFVETVVSPITDSDKKIIGFRGIARDITERKQLEEQLRHAHKMESIGTLAGGIAHDFNNLLMGIQGRTSLMLMDKDSSHPDFEHLKEIENYVKSAVDLTRQLLGFARGGKYEVKPTDINEMIKKTSHMFGRTKKEIKIHKKFQEDIWTVEADQGQIEQVLMNLYINAWQAMPRGGDIYIKTRNVILNEKYVKALNINPGRYVMISVMDTGIGMDEAIRQRIFEPFFTTKPMGRGTGLGLASAYGIIKNHGGFIKVYSKKGEGATFNIYLPASEKKAIEVKETSRKITKGAGTILLVDDEEMIIDVGKQMLEKLGYKVIVAKSGKQAINIYEKNKAEIDMVILDMIMHGMSGRETYDKLKKINPDIKVLLSSGYSINGQALEILNRGCDGFIQKPFNMREISLKISEISGKGQNKKI